MMWQFAQAAGSLVIYDPPFAYRNVNAAVPIASPNSPAAIPAITFRLRNLRSMESCQPLCIRTEEHDERLQLTGSRAEVLRFGYWNGKRFPLGTFQSTRDQYNFPNMHAVMRDLPLDRLDDGMRFRANHYAFLQVR